MPFTTTQTVYIVDALSYDISKPLIVRCQSKDDDLGNKTLNASEEFNFSFKENPFGGTLFFCHFWWNGKDTKFDVYNDKIATFCGLVDPSSELNYECFWKVQEDGFYFAPHRNPPPVYEKKHDWP
ncbi:hypothetical protein A4A49_51299 [Nicotiana attenuata]|uniref:S-protein homolog n=1 Tax=Nicotiana attenuata TaxID=49451 RepID=A0A1J6ITX0_NICAT|nr:hypothetical protein A4A49_51299 [Nicotiana attenuata]